MLRFLISPQSLCVCVLVLNCFIGRISAQEPAGLELPTEQAYWLNTQPITKEMLSGKGVVFWYFEESCPRCRAKWPEMYALASRYSDQPVMFIAVNSGTDRGQIMKYAADVKLKWPIIIDPSRSFETASGVGEISLQNIHQVTTLNGSGSFQRAQWNDLDASVEQALQGAAWKIDPQAIAPELKGVWQLIEFGEYSRGLQAIKTFGSGKSDEARTSLAKLRTYLDEQLQSELSDFEAMDEKSVWKRYQAALAINQRYKGMELPKEFLAKGAELHKNSEVRAELAAAQQLKKLQVQVQKANSREAAIKSINAFVARNPNTQAAAEALSWLETN